MVVPCPAFHRAEMEAGGKCQSPSPALPRCLPGEVGGTQSMELLRSREGGPRNLDGEPATSQRTQRPHKRLLALEFNRALREKDKIIYPLFYFTHDIVSLSPNIKTFAAGTERSRGQRLTGCSHTWSPHNAVLGKQPCVPPNRCQPESKRPPGTGKDSPSHEVRTCL